MFFIEKLEKEAKARKLRQNSSFFSVFARNTLKRQILVCAAAKHWSKYTTQMFELCFGINVNKIK